MAVKLQVRNAQNKQNVRRCLFRITAGERRTPLVWVLVLTCLLAYLPIGLIMGTGYFQFGPRYLLDLLVPLVVLTAIGIRRWPPALIVLAMAIGLATYVAGSILWWVTLRV